MTTHHWLWKWERVRDENDEVELNKLRLIPNEVDDDDTHADLHVSTH